MKKLANHEIVTIAVYLLGGDTKHVDTEDVAMKANALAQGRFTWRKYKDQINIETVRKRLWDAKKDSKGGFLMGSERDGWLLTEKGHDFAKRKIDTLGSSNLTQERLSLQEKQWRRNEYDRLFGEPALIKFENGERETITKREAEAFFRLNDYIVGKTREEKVQRILNAFGDDPVLGEAVRELTTKVRKR